MANIVVQPPEQIQVGVVLYPPLVIRTPETEGTFLQLVVFDSHNNVLGGEFVQGSIMKTPTSLGAPAAESAGGSTSTAANHEFTVFDDIIIIKSGTYRLVVNRCCIDYTAGEAVHVDRVVSRNVRVRRHSVAAETPCMYPFLFGSMCPLSSSRPTYVLLYHG